MGNYRFVSSEDGIEEIRLGLSIPDFLFSKDGRRFHITDWSSSISKDSVAIGQCSFEVSLDRDES